MKKFEKSLELFDKFKDGLGIVGFMNWEMTNNNILIQCWNTKDRGIVLIHVYPDGNGFQDYYMLTKKEMAATVLLDALKLTYTELELHNLNPKTGKQIPSTQSHFCLQIIYKAIKAATE